LQTWLDGVCTWGKWKSVASITPPSPGLSGTHFPTLYMLESIISRDEKNITTLKWNTEQLLIAVTHQLIPAVVKYKNLDKVCSLGNINHYSKITWKLQTWFDGSLYMGKMKKCNIPQTPSTGLTVLDFKHLLFWINEPIGCDQFWSQCYYLNDRVSLDDVTHTISNSSYYLFLEVLTQMYSKVQNHFDSF
jgi:hypothetical protein